MRRAACCVAVICPKAALVLAPPLNGNVKDEFGFEGLKWLTELNASARNSSVLRSATLKLFESDRSMFSRPGPYVNVVGVLPMPSDRIPGRLKLDALSG